jgi:hypothetical protein
MTAQEIDDLAREALDAAARLIQDRLGVLTGDLAGLYFTGQTYDHTIATLAGYIKAELSEA